MTLSQEAANAGGGAASGAGSDDDLNALWQECAADLRRMRELLGEQAGARERAEEELRRRGRELAALGAVTAAVSGSLELAEVLAALRRQLAEQLGVPGGCIYVVRQESGELELAGSWGLPEAAAAKIKSVPLAEFHQPDLIQKRRAVVCADARATALFASSQPGADEVGWRGYCGVALVADGAVQGVIELFDRGDFSEERTAFFTALGQQVGVAVYRARLFEQLYEGRERQSALARRLVAVQEEERRHLARELHDEVGQLLTGLKLSLEMGARGPSEGRDASLGDARRLVAELMSRVRQMSLDLRPGMLDDLGLLPALLWHFERYAAQTGVRLDFTHAGVEGLRFAPEVETAAYRIVQEALTNVARHARVNEARVRVRADEAILSVEIEDRGGGFNPRDALEAGTSSGLAGMGERARLLGGGLTIESAPGAGTTVTANLPLWDDANQGG
jgi:signal transduction histidine kinase